MSKSPPQDGSAQLCFTLEVADGFYLTRLSAPTVAASAVPGQFVSLKVADSGTPLLRVPLSLLAADPIAGTIEVLYERVGPKTACLSQLSAGARVPCLGPLGRGFPAPASGRTPLLVGGGVGLPPLLFLGRQWRAAGRQEAVVLAGARHAGKHLPAAMLAAAGNQVRQATDDGSLGRRGLVTDLLAEALEEVSGAVVYTCGPHPMMAAVARLCDERQVPCFASLEAYMACGYGVCVGCVVELAEGHRDGPYGRFSRVCIDGPVYSASQIAW
ncbi:MAG: dihydroorotate dehydrogenase electron transfer subunit [Gemmatimonadota bacterium]